MKPRRGLPEPSEPYDFDETELEMSAVRRGLWLDDEEVPRAPRRAARAAADEPEKPLASERDLAGVDLKPRQQADRQKPADKPKARNQPIPVADATRSRAKVAPGERRWRIGGVGAVLAGFAASFGIGALPGQPAPLPDTVPLVTAISRLCPAADAVASTLMAISSEGNIRVREIGQTGASEKSGPLTTPDQNKAAIIAPTGPQASVVGGSLIHRGEQTWWGSCRAALADQYVHLPGGEDAKVIVVNPEQDPALVDVTLSGPNGEITGDGLRGVTIAANSQRVFDLAPLAGSVDAVGVRVRSSVGRVTLVAQVDRTRGGDFATSTVQSTQLLIAAVPANPTRTQLLLTNPGTTRNVIKIETVSEAGRNELPGFESYALDAQRTVALDLTDAIGGLATALIISGRDEFSASAVVSTGDDFAIEAAQTADESIARQDLIGVVPGPGRLQIANPGAGEAVVAIDWGPGQAQANRTIAAGSVVSIEVPDRASLAHLTSTAPIAAAVILTSADHPGIAIAVMEALARSVASMPMEVEPGLGR